MVETRRGRIVALCALVGGLLGLLVWHGSLGPAPAAWAFPGVEAIAMAPGQYVGERVVVGGRIVGTHPVVIAADYGVDRVLRMEVVGLSASVAIQEGALLRVYGVLEAQARVRARTAFVVPRRGLWYTWTISFVAGLWVLGRIVRYWRVDPGALAIRRRADPLRVRSLLDGGEDA